MVRRWCEVSVFGGEVLDGRGSTCGVCGTVFAGDVVWQWVHGGGELLVVCVCVAMIVVGSLVRYVVGVWHTVGVVLLCS